MSSYWPRPGGHVISINQGAAVSPLRKVPTVVQLPDQASLHAREAGHEVKPRPMIMQGRGDNDFLSRVNGRRGE